jgi:histone deacetylase 1/2
MDNANTKDYLDKIRSQVVENLKRTAFAPSVQMTDVPRNPLLEGMDDDADDILDDLDEDENKDKRFTQRRFDQYVEKPGELSESEDEEENAANGVRRQPGAIRRRNITNYRDLDPADSGLDSGMATPANASSVADGDLDVGLDTKMTDAPRTEPDVSATASNDQDTPADVDQILLEAEEKDASAAASWQPSPPQNDEDTAMEDAAPAPEAEQSGPTTEAQEEKRPETSPGAEGSTNTPLSPQGQSATNEPSTSVPDKEGEGQESAPAEGSEAKATATESTDEPTAKKEE